ncbi:MAG: Phosphoserine aminotransferase [Gammaproteobacteria bacterium]|nr:Phosphoserine aminotransferase [Gammaproteobacteria bacterium]
MKPSVRPSRPFFSSGPCAKRPGWNPEVLRATFAGRSHRSAEGQARLKEVIDRSRALLRLPPDYRLAIVPGSDTGAMEAALWSLLGARGVDVLAWDSFGELWAEDITQHLRLKDVRVLAAAYGALPDLGATDSRRDIVFTWNGTTSGVRVPDGDWIAEGREGLTICDATSAAFAVDLPWDKLDAATWSWQKVLGGEGAHGMLALSPRAVARLESYTPPWPIPKLFRLTRRGRLMEEIFAGFVINTPSMLCVQDQIDALAWAESLGGLPALVARSDRSLAAIERWQDTCAWAGFLAQGANIRSSTSVCLRLVEDWLLALPEAGRRTIVNAMTDLLAREAVAYDIGAYRAAPPGLRIWCGATVETGDVEALLPWLDWAYNEVRVRYHAARQ